MLHHTTGSTFFVSSSQPSLSLSLKLESQLRQQRLRAESEAVDASQVKVELEAASSEIVSLQKQVGLLSRKNEEPSCAKQH